MADDLRNKPDSFWKEKLTPDQYRVLREGDTEIPFMGDYWDEKREGMYRCAACGEPLFSSAEKFDSGRGWPSFFTPVDPERIETREDLSLGAPRTEVRCKKCGGHLGHVFDDAPEEYKGRQTTGQRFCINSCALDFDAGGGKNERVNPS
jgi:peptide-methionine (R)-S-oxide reductase